MNLKEKHQKDKTQSLVFNGLIKMVTTAVTKETCRFYSPALTSAIDSVIKLFRNVVGDVLKDNGYIIAYEEKNQLYVSNNLSISEVEIKRLIDIVTDCLKKKLLKDKVIEEQGSFLKETPVIKPGPSYHYFFTTQIGAENNLKSVYLANVASNWVKSENLILGDTVELYSLFEKDLFYAIFHKQNPSEVIKNYLEKVNQGEFDDKLFYRKKIVKHLDKYEEPYPNHIQAAKKIPNFSSNWIEYAMTLKGCEARGHVVSTINYQHYINKFLKPLCELSLKETVYKDTLEDLFSTKPQMSLFGG